MKEIIEFISQPWPWYVAGPLITLTMFGLIFTGKRFGLSSNLRTMCSILGAGKRTEFFRFDWKADIWNLVFVAGLIIGGFLANYFLSADCVNISSATLAKLSELGVEQPSNSLVPTSIFSWESLLTFRGAIMLIGGGFLVGFGTRYAGGCTSGHAISGLSDLQLPSLIAVVGFFVGGLLATYFLLPVLLTL